MNLYLIGYRGSGKSTIGPLVAKLLGWTSQDADDWVETNAGVSIAEIFATQGEPAFRELESAAIRALAQQSRLVVSLGGGAPMAKSNQQQLSQSGKTIWLDAKPDVLWNRISRDDSTQDRRPDLTDVGGKAEVEQMLAVRNPVYNACADYRIDVGELAPEEIAELIVAWWNSDDKNPKT